MKERLIVLGHVALDGLTTQSDIDPSLLVLLIFALIFVFLIGLWLLLFRVLFPLRIYRSGAKERERDLQQLFTTGMPLAHINNGGSIGRLGFSGPTLGVTVYPGGVAIKPIFMPPAVIFNHEIKGVRVWSWGIVEGIYIDHSGRSIVTPIGVPCGPSHPLRMLLLHRFGANSGAETQQSYRP